MFGGCHAVIPGEAATANARIKRLVEAWRACERRRGLSRKLRLAVVDASKLLADDTAIRELLAEPAAANALVGITARADQLNQRAFRALMDILTRAIIHETVQKNEPKMGYLRALLKKCATDRKCFGTVAKFPLKSLSLAIDASAIVLESRENGADLVETIVKYLQEPGKREDTINVVQLTEKLIWGKQTLGLDDIGALIKAVKQCLERNSTHKDVRTACEMCLLNFCRHVKGATPDLESLLVELNAFDHVWCYDNLLKYPNKFTGMVENVCACGPTVQLSFVKTECFDRILTAALKDPYHAPRSDIVLMLMLEKCHDQCLDAIIRNPLLRRNLIPSREVHPRSTIEVLRCLLGRHSARSSTTGMNWLVLQLYLAKYLVVDFVFRQNIAERIVSLMQSYSMALCFKEMRDFPIHGLLDRYLDERGAALFDIRHQARLESRAMDVLWLLHAIGFQTKRSELREWMIDLNESEPILAYRLESRSMGTYSIIWAVGVASLERFRSLADSRHWMSREMWRLVWDMTCEW